MTSGVISSSYPQKLKELLLPNNKCNYEIVARVKLRKSEISFEITNPDKMPFELPRKLHTKKKYQVTSIGVITNKLRTTGLDPANNLLDETILRIAPRLQQHN